MDLFWDELLALGTLALIGWMGLCSWHCANQVYRFIRRAKTK